MAFCAFAVVFSAFGGFDLEEGFLASSGASFSDLVEFVLERFGGGDSARAGEAARLRAGMLRDLGCGFSGAFSAGWAGFAEAARADRLGGIAERRKKKEQGPSIATGQRSTGTARDSRVVGPCLFASSAARLQLAFACKAP